MSNLGELNTLYDNLNDEDIAQSIKVLETIFWFNDVSENGIKLWEKAIYRLAAIFEKKGLIEDLIELTKQVLPMLKDIP